MIMLTKTNELTDAPLDWAVAKCLTLTGAARGVELRDGVPMVLNGCWAVAEFSYNWDQGGPIIEREITKVFRNVGGIWSAMVLKDVSIPPEDRGTSLALTRRAQWNGAGPTPLIAAMRCYVASKLGNEVDIPKELL